MMYTKLSGGESYDVLIPSDYMIERLIKEDYLQYIDWDLIPNKGSLMDEVMNKSYDPGNRYSCPYFWGTVGIQMCIRDRADPARTFVRCDPYLYSIYGTVFHSRYPGRKQSCAGR